MLLRERHNGFVRFHAARSLVLFGAIVLVQLLLFARRGPWQHHRHGGDCNPFGLLVLIAYFVLAICGLILWLRLLAEAMAGNGRVYPYLDYWAVNLELLVTRVQRRLSAGFRPGKNLVPI